MMQGRGWRCSAVGGWRVGGNQAEQRRAGRWTFAHAAPAGCRACMPPRRPLTSPPCCSAPPQAGQVVAWVCDPVHGNTEEVQVRV